MSPVSFEDFLNSIRSVGGGPSELDPATGELFEQAVAALRGLADVDRDSLAALVQQHPKWVPVLALCVGLSQEQLKNTLKYRLGSAGWITLARKRPAELVELLDVEFRLIARIEEQRARDWSFADVLLERYGGRSRASRAIGRGRSVEDEVERIVAELRLPREMRTRFVGRGGETGNDLRRIHRVWQEHSIDGLYSLSHMAELAADLKQAAKRLGILAGPATK